LIRTLLAAPLALAEAALTVSAQSLAIVRCHTFLPYDYRTWLRRDLADCDSILELGCGSNSPILQIGYGQKTTAVDIFEPYIAMHNRLGNYRHAATGNVLTYEMHPRTFDAVVMCDVLEHLSTDAVEARRLFERMESTARKKVILFTPNGWVDNDQVDGNLHQEHKSAWEPADYLQRGYSVKGTHGWRWIVGKAGLPKRKPYSFWSIVAMLSLPLIYDRPEWAAHSYAVKI
jgi:2-polyprenyl-3-methyl-5-hydroxy-6-metoxy-1,4-benzoquinol methylase